MKPIKFSNALAKVIIYGTMSAMLIMLTGLIALYIIPPGHIPSAHIFNGEPSNLTNPWDMLKAALHGNDLSIMQIGVLLLLLNPIFRIGFSTFGFLRSKDRLYTIVSFIVFVVLMFSLLY